MRSESRKKMASSGLLFIGALLMLSVMYSFADEGIPALGVLLETIGQGLDNIKG